MDKLSDKRRCDVHVDEYFTKEGAIEHLDLIVTGVPRAGRDPELTSAPASTPLTRIAERQPEGVALRVSTTLGERDLYMKEHHPRPTPPPDTSERRYVRATISPQSEGHPGILIEGTYMLSNGTVQVFDMRALCWAQNRSSQETTSKLLRDDCCGREERPAFTLRFRTRPSLCTNWQSRIA